MPSKNDLSALKKTALEPILPTTNAPKTSAQKGAHKPSVGRPKSKDKRDYKVTLSLTEKEGAILGAKAGLAAEATVVYAHLKKTGFFD